MYLGGQIVFDLDEKVPVRIDNVWDPNNYPNRTTHFIEAMNGKYTIALPKTIEEAKRLLKHHRIVPAPTPYSHCWDCHQWLDGRLHFKWCRAVKKHRRGNYE